MTRQEVKSALILPSLSLFLTLPFAVFIFITCLSFGIPTHVRLFYLEGTEAFAPPIRLLLRRRDVPGNRTIFYPGSRSALCRISTGAVR
jgi:hypothetical protein